MTNFTPDDAFVAIASSDFPALKHHPAPLPAPAEPRTLSAVRRAFLKNPDVNLDEQAAGIVTAGLIDPHRFRMLVEPHASPTGETTSLLNRKPVSEGNAYITPQHDRFIDFGILPDLAGPRWGDSVTTALDIVDATLSPAQLGTAKSPEGGALAVLEISVSDHAELAARVVESFERTAPGPNPPSGQNNNYTDSILSSGVKEPLMLMLMRVKYNDSSPTESYLMAADGNSRLLSLWRGRTGGDVLTAANACVKAVIGEPTGSTWKRPTQRVVRTRLEEETEHLASGLKEAELTAATIRLGQTLAAPTVIVVGGRTPTGDPLTDVTAARDDLIGSVHTEHASWRPTAKTASGMAKVVSRATRVGLISSDERCILEGRTTVDEMHAILGVPPHRLWAMAFTHVVILNPYYNGMKEMLREEFSLRANPTRAEVSRSLSSAALAGYRSEKSLQRIQSAFDNGGVVTESVWKTHIVLTQGSNPLGVLDEILTKALDDSHAESKQARIELSILGGGAGIFLGLLTAARGSKEARKGIRDRNVTPYRAHPTVMISDLSGTKGGLKTLHSMAVRHIDDTMPVKKFRSHDDANGAFNDGDPILDDRGVHESVLDEWDIAFIADTQRAEDAIAANKVEAQDANQPSVSPESRARQDMKRASDEVVRAVKKLAAFSKTRGQTVFGTYDSAEQVKTDLQSARDLIDRHGPHEPDDEIEEMFDEGHSTSETPVDVSLHAGGETPWG